MPMEQSKKLHQTVFEELQETEFWDLYKQECEFNSGEKLSDKETLSYLIEDLQCELNAM